MRVIDAQKALAARDFDPGPIDGKFGRRTSSALRSFQISAGLHSTGMLDVQTIAALSKPVPASGASAILRQGSRGHLVNEIVMHCSATPRSWMIGATFHERFEEIRRWHMQERKWRDIGYHWVIDRDGSVLSGRSESEIGAHVVERNAGTVGICLIGGHGSSSRDRFEDHFTAAQDDAARRLIAEIRARAGIVRVSGHNEYANKACPGFIVSEWLEAT
jgi:peptidoglycan hydrolase-like protein with peptidoglycan-binding domain